MFGTTLKSKMSQLVRFRSHFLLSASAFCLILTFKVLQILFTFQQLPKKILRLLKTFAWYFLSWYFSCFQCWVILTQFITKKPWYILQVKMISTYLLVSFYLNNHRAFLWQQDDPKLNVKYLKDTLKTICFS